MDQQTLMNLQMFYPPFPKKVQFGQHTYIEPNFEVKFPVFRCCPNHSMPQTKAINAAKDKCHDEEEKNNEHERWFGLGEDDDGQDMFMLDDEDDRHELGIVQSEAVNSKSDDHAKTDLFILDEEPLPSSSNMNTVKKEDTSEIEEDHGELDDFVLDEPVITNQQDLLPFLRPNLVFDVIPKSSANFRKAIDNLRAIHPRGAGIVFCMAKNECDEIATMIGDDARPFHADIADRTRKDFYQRWMNNEVLFLCATVGLDKMGVDKRNVRFVLHHTMPQTLQTYEKQCSYAGRDAKLAHCVLFYNFNDHLRLLRLIRNDVPKPPANVLQMKEKALWDVMRYGENVAECRRKILARYFGQNFDPDHCIMQLGPCTICEYKSQGNPPMPLVDFTRQALCVMWSMNGLKSQGVVYVADLFRGHITKKSVKKGLEETDHGRLPLLGVGQDLSATDCLRFIQMLIIEEYLKLRSVTTRHNTVVGYCEIGSRGREFIRKYKQPEQVPPNERIFMHISPRKEKRRSSVKGGGINAAASSSAAHDPLDDFYMDDDYDFGPPPNTRMRME